MPAPTPTDEPLVVHVDVTDTVATHWRAGIQRVVAQLVHQLSADPRLRVVPVVWLESVRGFRSLTDVEAARLAPRPVAGSRRPAPGPHPGGDAGGCASRGSSSVVRASTRAVQRLRPLLGRARRWIVAALTATGVEPVLRRARRWVLARTRDRRLVAMRIEPAPHSVLFEMDTVWNNTWVDRAELYAALRGRGVHVAVLIYDLLPQQHPEWFEASLVAVSDRTIAAQAARAEVVMAISADTATAFARWAQQRSLHPPPAHVIALGADAAGSPGTSERPSRASLPRELVGVDYILTVGTVEPRKNHATLLDAFDRLVAADRTEHLVVVGRPGWHNDEVIERLATHQELGRRLHWFRAADDDLLATLYDHARVVAVASITEGYGLPVIEAMSHGVPVVSSNGGALVEAGGDLVTHVDALDVDAWVRALDRHLRDDTFVAMRRDALAGYAAPRWSDTGAQVAEILLSGVR